MRNNSIFVKNAQLDIMDQLEIDSNHSWEFPTFNTPSTHLSPAKVSPVYDAYWYFAYERQNVFFNRLRQKNGRWTDDPIISQYKFTNAYRAADRVSQFLIRNIIYRDDLPSSASEVFFRIILFKLFNKIETWEALEAEFGAITWEDYSYSTYDKFLSFLKNSGKKIYSAAYIMHPGSSAFHQKLKHQNHLKLLEMMMNEHLFDKLCETKKMQDGFTILRKYPIIGDFLGYQLITDLNYSEIVDYSEMEFVVPGPGALDGISKCFPSLGGLNPAEMIRYIASIQEEEFDRLGFNFKTLWGRRLQLIDCQNLFCEISKYSRASHPGILGSSGRTRIKQKFTPISKPIQYWFPPKWGINERIQK